MVETYTESPDSRKPQKTGATVVPGGIEFPRPSELGSSRDSLGRLGTGPDKFGGIRIVPSGRKEPGPSAEGIHERPLPAAPQTPATLVAEPVAMMIATFDTNGDAMVDRAEWRGQRAAMKFFRLTASWARLTA